MKFARIERKTASRGPGCKRAAGRTSSRTSPRPDPTSPPPDHSRCPPEPADRWQVRTRTGPHSQLDALTPRLWVTWAKIHTTIFSTVSNFFWIISRYMKEKH